MTLENVLSLLRRLINETDLTTATLTDLELLQYIRDAIEVLGLRKIADLDQTTVQELITLPNYGINPTPTVEQAHMFCLQAAIYILGDEYRGKVSRGELGISWRSGNEEESSGGALSAWQGTISGFESELDLLIMFNKSGRHGFRSQ